MTKNPFFYLSAGLLIFIIAFISFQAGKTTTSTPEETAGEINPILAVYDELSPSAKALYFKQSEGLTKPVPDRLVELDKKTIGCFGPSQVLAMNSNAENLGGQCCGALTDANAYELQMKTLSAFIDENGGEAFIPVDPYDAPVSLAQQLTQYDSEILLNTAHQGIFDDALSVSHHGPCCCKCWKWYMMSGLAKKLIRDEEWDSQQVAQLWDLSSSCGHAEDTNMGEHYTA